MPANDQPKESLLGRAVQAVLKDGTLAAAWRQGLGEIGEALKAFPDSIHVRELGTIGAPTPGEIASGRGVFGQGHEQENESLLDQARAAGPDPGQFYGRGHEHGR